MKIKPCFGTIGTKATFAFFGTIFQFQGKCKQRLLLNRTPVLQLKQVLQVAPEPNIWFYDILKNLTPTPFNFFHQNIETMLRTKFRMAKLVELHKWKSEAGSVGLL